LSVYSPCLWICTQIQPTWLQRKYQYGNS
jgi:hypothetical protein